MDELTDRGRKFLAVDKHQGVALHLFKEADSGLGPARELRKRLAVRRAAPELDQPELLWVSTNGRAFLETWIDGPKTRALSDLDDERWTALSHTLAALYAGARCEIEPARTAYRRARHSLVRSLARTGLWKEFPLDWLDDLAEEALPARAKAARVDLVHGDLVLWLNVLWDDEESPVLIDWADASKANLFYDVTTLLAFDRFDGRGHGLEGLQRLSRGEGRYAEAVRPELERVVAASDIEESYRVHVFLSLVELLARRARKKGYEEANHVKRYLQLLADVFRDQEDVSSLVTPGPKPTPGNGIAMDLRKLYRENVPEPIRARVRSKITQIRRGPEAVRKPTPGRIVRWREYKKEGLAGVAANGIRLLRENERVYPYQPLYGLEDAGIDGLTETERPCEDRWSALEPHLPRRGSFLDVGSQNGYFVFRAAEHGLTAVGVERDSIAHKISKLTGLANELDQASFIQMEVSLDTIENLPSCDVLSCMSVFHHWVREHDLDYATQVMEALADRTNSTMIFETGQHNEDGAWWAPLLDFMGDDPERWVSEYLIDLGFSKVENLGEFEADHVAGVPRSLFIARK